MRLLACLLHNFSYHEDLLFKASVTLIFFEFNFPTNSKSAPKGQIFPQKVLPKIIPIKTVKKIMSLFPQKSFEYSFLLETKPTNFPNLRLDIPSEPMALQSQKHYVPNASQSYPARSPQERYIWSSKLPPFL